MAVQYSLDSSAMPYDSAAEFVWALNQVPGISAHITQGGIAIDLDENYRGAVESMNEIADESGVSRPYRGLNERERFFSK